MGGGGSQRQTQPDGIRATPLAKRSPARPGSRRRRAKDSIPRQSESIVFPPFPDTEVTMSPRVLLLAAAVLSASSCTLLVNGELTCSQDSDCTHGAVCQEGVCVQPAATDAGPQDGGEPDSGLPDAGQNDGGTPDADTTAPTVTITSQPPAFANQATASLAFTCSETDCTFHCALNGAASADCTSPKDYSGLAEGDQHFEVRASDLAGNLGPAASYDWTIDLTPPQTQLDTPLPAALNNSASLSFPFSSSESVCTFECQLDSAGFAPCTSPFPAANLTDGSHTLEVRATDRAGNVDPTPATFSWTTDRTPPTTTISSAPSGAVNLPSASVAFTCSETSCTFECAIDSGPSSPCTSPLALSSLTEGLHQVMIVATDAAGNVEATAALAQWTVDLTAPTSHFTSQPAALGNSSSVSFGFACNEASCTFECRLDSGAFAACTSPASHTVTDGAHTFEVRATDAAGNTETQAISASFDVDTIPPDTSFTSTPAATTSQTTASFSLACSEASCSFRCSLDGATPTACTSPATFSGLTAGSHTFSAEAIDAAGNADLTPATFSWTIDTSAVDTLIDTNPPAATQSKSASFTFHCNKASCTFECALDGAAFAACTSPATHAGLAEGSHTFEVRATDSGGVVDATPASYTWSVDVTAPTTTISAGPSTPTNATSATLTFAANESATFECKLDAGAWAACTSPHSTGTLLEGSHTFEVRATDAAGNLEATPVSHTWTIDLTPPVTTIGTKPANPSNVANPSFAFSASETATFECKLDTGAWAACSSPHSTGTLLEGSHTFEVRATDSAGNLEATPVSHTWTIDLTLPVTSIGTSPANPSNVANPSFAFSASETATFECRLDAGTWAACTSPHSTGALLDGTHYFSVRATDAAGNVESVPPVYTWVVDLTPPTTSFGTKPSNPSNVANPSIAFSANETATFECRLDAGTWAACTSPHSTSTLLEGSHTFEVRATDTVGNLEATPVSFTWTIDLTPPVTTLGTKPANPSNVANPSFAFSASETATFECKLDTGAWATCTSPHSTGTLLEGSHTFEVRATDAAGNLEATPVSFTWTIDLTLPVTTIGTKPANPSNVANPSFAFTASETATFECKLDTGAWTACTSPHSTGALLESSHTFAVRATDPAGNLEATPVSHTWTVDLTPPTTTVTSAPSGTVVGGTASIAFSSSETGCTFSCTVDAGAPSSCTSPLQLSGLAAGAHQVTIAATDAAGNSEVSPPLVQWTVNLCGDGILQTGETCDDSNNAPGDGCSPSCAVEASYQCSGLGPSVCAAIPAGDNNILWDFLFHGSSASPAATTFVPGQSFTFVEALGGGPISATTPVVIYALTDFNDVPAADVRTWDGTAANVVAMEAVDNFTAAFQGQAAHHYQLWRAQLPAHATGTIWYRVRLYDGTAKPVLKAVSAAGDVTNPLSQVVRGADNDPDDYSYLVP